MKNYLQESKNPFGKDNNNEDRIKNIYWGEVISIDDETDGGRIKVRIEGLDNKFENENLTYCYPLIPKFIHIYPQVGEIVRILIEDVRYPQRSRFWIGSVISQPQKIGFDNRYSALSTTNLRFSAPQTAPSKIPDAQGIYPTKNDIGILGKCNTDIIFRNKDVELRAGKHELNNNLKLNKKNPASLRLTFDVVTGSTSNPTTISNNILMGDRIALISHDGIPKFKSHNLTLSDREKIFNEAHPIGRGDTIVEALELLRKAIIQHIHPYSNLPADKSGIVLDLEKINFDEILQKNIVIN